MPSSSLGLLTDEFWAIACSGCQSLCWRSRPASTAPVQAETRTPTSTPTVIGQPMITVAEWMRSAEWNQQILDDYDRR